VTPDTAFPIAKNKDAFISVGLAKIKGAKRVIRKRITALKPYAGGNDALWKLHRLDIADKHKLLLIVGDEYTSVVIDPASWMRQHLGPDNFPDDLTMPIGIRPADRQFPLEDGDVLFRSSQGSSPKQELHDDPKFTFDVAFGEGEIIEGEPLLPTLVQFTDVVEAIVRDLRRFT